MIFQLLNPASVAKDHLCVNQNEKIHLLNKNTENGPTNILYTIAGFNNWKIIHGFLIIFLLQ